ncbi:unnamed protein product [Lactuca saligna]|uniref:SWIM-type domain-containing protein n=1 Tax=Lactuca saligna TaxID=75948 RepID=A0AA35Z964_LACSI|nr:unnamed protein product [Lactuca saligna]
MSLANLGKRDIPYKFLSSTRLHQTMVFETEAADQAIEPYIYENVDTNDFVEATYELEEVNDFGVNIEIHENDVDDERILGKVFDTPDDAYTFYNDYSFLHGFVESRRVAEEDEDFKTMNSRPVLSSVHPIEAKAGQIYTRKMFDTFKKEWTEAITNLTHETITKTTEESTYRVGQLDVDNKYWRIVTFRSLNQVSITCSCSMYETNGILCKHSLYVMKKKHVQELPSHYILPRWTLDARYKLGSVSIGLEEINNENGVSAYTLFCVRSNFTKLIEQARDSHSEIQKLNKILTSLLNDQANRKKSMSLENTSQSSCMGVSQVDMMPQLSIRDPLGPVTTKGRPKLASRIKSSVEAPKK